MLHKTRGIVLHHIPYSDSSIIIKVFTEQYGMLSCILQGIKGDKKSLRNFISSALALVNLDIYHRETRTVQRIREAALEIPFSTLNFDPIRRQYALCIAEIIYRTVREEEPNQPLYDFIRTTAIELDTSTELPDCFVPVFMVRLSSHLGFFPMNNHSPSLPVFDLRNGKFITAPAHPDCIPPPFSGVFSSVVKSVTMHETPPALTPEQRKELVSKMIRYYHIHLSGMHRIRSLEMTEDLIADLS